MSFPRFSYFVQAKFGDSIAIRVFQFDEMLAEVNVRVHKHRPIAGITAGIEEHAFEKRLFDLTVHIKQLGRIISS